VRSNPDTVGSATAPDLPIAHGARLAVAPTKQTEESLTLLAKRYVQPGSEDDVVLLFQGRRVGHVNIGEGVLPSQPLAHLRGGAEIKGPAEVTSAVEIREEIQTLVQHRGLSQLMHQFFAEGEGGKVAG
jgi:hypothetical protein